MAQQFKAPVQGLALDGNGIVNGGLRRADNVICSAPGVVTPRPGFALHTTKATAYYPQTVHVYRDEPVCASWNEASWRLENTSSTLTGNVVPLDHASSRPVMFEARQNLYITSDTGLRKMVTASSNAGDCGLEGYGFNFGPVVATGGDAVITDAGQVSHAFVLSVEDANGYRRRSAPIEVVQPVAASATAHYFDFSQAFIYFPSTMAAGDIIEMYRTRHSGSSSVAPTAEFYLVAEITLTSTDITNGYAVPPNDNTQDAALGAALYTNPSQLGVENAKEPPPAAACAAMYEGCAWYGNTLDKERVFFSLIEVGGATAARISGIQTRTQTGNFTSGSNTVTNISNSAGFRVGMYVTDRAGGPAAAGTYVPADTTITSITGAGPYTITMSANALATGAGISLTVGDFVTVNGLNFYAHPAGQWQPGTVLYANHTRCFFCLDTGNKAVALSATANALAGVLNVQSTIDVNFGVRATALSDPLVASGSARPGELLLEEIGVGIAAITVSSSYPNNNASYQPAFSPLLPLTTSADRKPNRLYWSEPGEPEAVPLGQFVDIGSELSPIIALVPLRSALLVFKADGLFRVTGTAPDGWRVDLLDPTVRLVYGSCVDRLDNAAYAWTRGGIYECTEGGARSISRGLVDSELLDDAQWWTDPTQAEAATYYVRAWQQRSVLVVGRQTDTLVWSSVTRQWSRWLFASSAFAEDSDGRAYRSDGAAWDLLSSSLTTYVGVDRLHTLTGGSGGFANQTIVITDAQRGAWTPKAGDLLLWVVDSQSQYRRVIDAVQGSGIYTLTIDASFAGSTISSRSAYEGVVSTVQWQAFVAGSPGTGGLWREIHAHFDWSRFAKQGANPIGPTDARVTLGATSSDAAGESLVSEVITRAALPGISARGNVPVEHGRSHVISPLVRLSEFKLDWSLVGSTLVYEPTSERVRR